MTPYTLLPLAALVAAAPAFAANSYSEGRLNNGLHYVLLNTPAEPGRLEIRLQVNAGASDENTGETGAAHMVEHMVYRAAPGYPQGIGTTLMNNSWQRGRHFNAMTNYERTLYMFSPPKGTHQAEETLQALAAMLDQPDFTAADWQKEQQIILAEWRNGRGVNERMNRQRTAAIRSGSRQARYGIIGTPESISGMNVAALQAFHQRWYRPGNMQLLVAGDLKNTDIVPLLQRTLGRLKPAPIPQRGADYYEPVLQSGWHTAQLQDRDSGGSHVAVIFRLDDSPSRDNHSREGARARLIDRYAAHIISRRLKNEQSRLGAGISNITLRKADIGRHTVAIGLFASVAPDRHAQGLSRLLQLRQQMLDHPVTDAEISAYTQTMRGVVARAAAKTRLPEPFGDIIRSVGDNFFAGKPIRTQAENAAIVGPMLDSISAGEVQARIAQWLNADDKLVQYQAPSLTPITLAEPAAIAAEAERTAQAGTPAPLPEAQAGQGTFAAHAKPGTITAEHTDKQHRVTYWQLSNGDRVVWLKSAQAGDSTYFASRAENGYLNPELNPWLSQLATQIVWQSAPQGWNSLQLDSWRKQQKTFLSQNLQDNHWQISGHARGAADLLRLYHAYQTTPQIGEDYREPLLQMMRQLAVRENGGRAQQAQAATDLRFGHQAYAQPTQEDLAAIEPDDLLQQFEQLSHTPAVHYLVSNQRKSRLKPLVARYLASIERQPHAADIRPYAALPGAAAQHLAAGTEQRSDVNAWSWTAQPWQPETAARTTLLANIAAQHLKAELRDKALGVYSLRFESSLNEKLGRIESHLQFAGEPARADALWQSAEHVLQTLPDRLTQAEINAQAAQFAKAETARLKSPETLLNRLMLSERHYGDARYLSSMQQLSDGITLENMRDTARLLWQPANRKVLVIDPQP
ncbi:insulinase family protein [Uruburuella testudinis]|uniref:Insulinase family protein n=1 Tax=Uruburuella testudinis TaxID=1282863 RepID=A0ABY4DVI2_9NEIS|nr:M16 family metallopeptidase [Uruburuella testudinis]UOO82627.1 insulinase family protein [Uruburuella testudinis]